MDPVRAQDVEELTMHAIAAHRWLLLSDEPLQYLLDRGITMESIEHFQLGLSMEDTFEPHYEGRITLPYTVSDGSIVDVRFHCFQAHEHKGHGKYETRADMPARLFNVASLLGDPRNPYVVCEGEFDAILLHQLGCNAVAVAGVHAVPDYVPHLLPPGCLVIGDDDRAGREFARDFAALIDGRRLVLPLEGATVARSGREPTVATDVTDAYALHGPEWIKEQIWPGR